jgi:glycogen debranching enzyme
MYERKDKAFYAVKQGNKIRFVSVASLFPLLLSNVSEDKIGDICTLIESEEYFNSSFPLSSTPIRSTFYDPSYYEKRLWRGPVWINMNWYIIEGLIKQKYIFRRKNKKLSLRIEGLIKHLSYKTSDMVSNGCFEFYHPITGKGMRISSFSWSTLGYIIQDKIKKGVIVF